MKIFFFLRDPGEMDNVGSFRKITLEITHVYVGD